MSQACLSDSVMWRKKRTSRREIRKKSICIIFWSTLYRFVIFSRIPCVIQIYMPVLFCFKIKHSPRSWRAHQVKVLVIIENSKQSATMRRKWPQVFRVTLFSPNHMSNQTKEISSNAFAFFRKLPVYKGLCKWNHTSQFTLQCLARRTYICQASFLSLLP